MSDNYDDMLGGRVTPSASFNGQFPIRWSGVVEDVTRNPAYDYDPSKPNNRGAQKFWPDGNPVMHVWVTLQTDVRDPSIQNDDGRRVLVLDSKNKLEAVQAAVRESGSSFLKGGRLDIEYYGDDPNGKNPNQLPKLYRARYQPPSLDSMLDNGQSQAAPPTQPAQGGWGAPAPAPASPAPATGGWGSPPPQAAPSPQPSAANWGSTPAAPAAPAPASSPGAGWGSPTPAAAPTVDPGLVRALQSRGIQLPPGATQELAEQIAASVGLTRQ